MRRLATFGVLSMLVLPASTAAVPAAPGDGTLTVRGATGVVSVAIRGAAIGQIDRGKVWIDDATPDDGKPPVVWGWEAKRDIGETKLLYSGTDIRFRVIGGFFRLRVAGSGVDLSVVGRGSVTLSPAANSPVAGTYSLDGGQPKDFPDFVTSLQLGAAPPPGG